MVAIEKILVFGNALVAEDSLPLRLLPLLRKEFPKVAFKELDAVEQLEDEGKDLIILDSAKGISKIEIINESDLDKIQTQKAYSLHDFDLGMTLKLLKKIGKINLVRIIAIPTGYLDPPKKVGSIYSQPRGNTKKRNRDNLVGCGYGEKKALEEVKRILKSLFKL